MAHDVEAKFLSLKQAAQAYPLSRRTLWGLVHEGRLQAFRLGRKLIVRREDLERLLTSAPVTVDLDRIVNEMMSELGVGK